MQSKQIFALVFVLLIIMSFTLFVYQPDDDRLSIEPDFPVDLSAVDYFNQRDPQLEFILDY